MCGIAGIFSATPLPAEYWIKWCRAFSANMSHRGPDDEGFALFDGDWKMHSFSGETTDKSLQLPGIDSATGEFYGCMVHRRLSIVNLSAQGHQPMCTEDGRYTLVYNGEAFNFHDIDRQFGFNNRTATDTESVLNLLSVNSSADTELIDGFFALGLVDAHRKLLYLRRDPTGVKPLYYAEKEGLFAFSSENKPLRSWLGQSDLNKEAIRHLLAEGVFVKGIELFENINHVNDGLSLNLSTFELVEDYQYSPSEELPENDLRDDLLHSIKYRMLSDVPVGFAVSGGLDSAVVIGMARQFAGTSQKLKLFSVRSTNPASDESKWQQQVAEYNDAEWHSINIEEAGPQVLLHHARATDLPAIAWNNIAHFELCRLAKSHGITVFFNGQGADELFMGYPDYLIRDFLSNPYFYWSNRKKLPLSFQEMFKGAMKLGIKNLIPNVHDNYVQKEADKWLCRFTDKTDAILPRFNYASAGTKMQLDYYGQKLGQMLMWEDRNGMAYSIESRNPFADDKTLARWLNTDIKARMIGGYTKGVLREAAKGFVPESVRLRVDKKGFTVPDAELTWKHRFDFEPLFMSSLLDSWSPRNVREKALKQLQHDKTKELGWYFRLSAFAAFLDQKDI